MKKLFAILLVVSVLALSFCGCTSSKAATETEVSSSKVEQSSQPEKITDEKAIEIASEHWGIKNGDKDEKTGFVFALMPVESGNDNIRIDLKWLVNGTNYSTVDSVEIDPYSGEILTK